MHDPAHRGALSREVARRHPSMSRHEVFPDTTVWLRGGPGKVPILSNAEGSLMVLGSLFERGTGRDAPSRTAPLDTLGGTPDDMARALIEDHWGSYLAFLRCRETGRLSVLRDPSGAVPATIAGTEHHFVVSDQIPRWLHEMVVGRPSLNWTMVLAQLHDPTLTSHRSLLEGVTPIVAGCLLNLGGTGTPRLIWRPDRIAAAARPDVERLAERVRDTVRDGVAALTRSQERMVIELSGGLDSAILLGCLARSHPSGSPLCINLATPQPSGDEVRYARAAAERANAILTEVMLNAEDMDYSFLADQSSLSEPSLYGTDASHERLVTATAHAHGASAIVSGQGGDAVFFQEPTALVAVDHIQAAGFGHATWRTVVECADRSHGSIWSVLAAWRARKRPRHAIPLVEHDLKLLGHEARTAPQAPCHPWLLNADALPPAKALQLRLLAACQFFRGPTPRADGFSLIQPLLAQPVVELALGIPTWLLAQGRLDRGLARSAFGADLPPLIARRRGKGEVSSYYSHAILANLPFLRELLIDGLLAERGLLDRAVLEQALSEESLVQRPDHRVLVGYASLEGWLRSWS